MGRTTAAPRSRTVHAEEAVAEEPVGLELAGVGLCLASVLFAAALVTLSPADAAGSFRNVAGPLGRELAGTVTRTLGLGAWLLPVFGLVWGYHCLRGRRPRHWVRKALVLPVAAALLGTLGALVLGRACPPGLERCGPGGYLGVALGHGLFVGLGKGASLVVLVGLLGSLRLLVDVRLRPLFARLVGDGTAVLPDLDEDEYEDDTLEDETLEEDEVEWVYEEDPEGDEEPEEDDVDLEVDAAEPAPTPARRTPPPTPVIVDRPPPPRTRPAPKPRKPKRKPRSTGPDSYVFPPTDILDLAERHDEAAIREEVDANALVLGDALASFGVDARVVSSQRGPVITFFEIAIASGVRLNRVTALADDLAIALKAPSVRIVAPIPGRNTVGVEVPNLTREAVVLRDLVEECPDASDRKSLPIFLGRDTAGRPLLEDLAKMPHLLIAGATGSGKSVCINSILISFMYTRTPDEVHLILIDPKQVELSFFEGIPHLITPVVTDMKRAAKILEWAVDRMEDRYTLLLAGGVRNVAAYNALSKEKHDQLRERSGLSEEDAPDHLPQVVIVVDELADLMMTNGKEVEAAITRLAQKSRAVGIHIVLATQRPSTNVITGLIKANMPTRIGFCVSSKIDSRVILDSNGADKLLGMGDMLYMHPRSLHLRRGQGTLVTDSEVRAVVDFLKDNCPAPDYQDLLEKQNQGRGDPMSEDDLYNDAVRAVLATRLGSASMLQRRMAIGYTRASRLIDMMCDQGVVGPHVGSKAREVLYTLEEWEAARAQAEAAPGPVALDDDVVNMDESWD